MSINYKVKKKKRKPSDSKITLDAQHRNKINEITKLETSLPSLKRELKKNIKEKDKLLKSNDGFGFIESDKGKKIYILNQKINKLNRTISQIEKEKIKDEYYSKTAHILYEYYDNVKAVSQRHTNKSTDNELDKMAEEYEYGKNFVSGTQNKKNSY